MSERKALKKELRGCKKQIKRSNYAVRGFMRMQYYQPGSYRKLQTTKIWVNAKNQLLHYHELKYRQLICFKCGQVITSNPVLHHKKYNWKKLFAPQYIRFVHQECHSAVHSVKRGYKKSLNYSQIRLLISITAVIILLIVWVIISITTDL